MTQLAASLLVELDANGVRVSRLHQHQDEVDYIHDPVLNCWLEVLVQGRSMSDVFRAIEEQARLVTEQ